MVKGAALGLSVTSSSRLTARAQSIAIGEHPHEALALRAYAHESHFVMCNGFRPRHVFIVAFRLKLAGGEMNSGAGRTLQRDVCQAIIDRHVIAKLRKPWPCRGQGTMCIGVRSDQHGSLGSIS